MKPRLCSKNISVFVRRWLDHGQLGLRLAFS